MRWSTVGSSFTWLALVGCSSSAPSPGAQSSDDGIFGVTDSSTGGAEPDDTSGRSRLDVPSGDEGGDGGADGDCGCQDVLDGIYVLNNTNPPSVWFFDPPANTFSQVGTLGCSAPLGWTTNSMAIDRQGNAWLNYYDGLTGTGKIFRAPLGDLGSCEELPYQQPDNGWFLLGMGYAVTNPASSCDELFVYNSDRYGEYPLFGAGGSQLARYDEQSHQLDIVGSTDYPVGELTGTGDGRLFTFAAVDQGGAVLVHLDKETGKEFEHRELALDITNAFAFAFWGGDVYFFTETAPLSGVSKVTKLDYDGNEGGELQIYNPNSGIHIPGAGVSTCASFTPVG
jgi:hypothetical protein